MAIVGRLGRCENIKYVFYMESRPTVVKSVVESANSGIESADSATDSAIIPLKIVLWVWAFKDRLL